MPRLKANTTIYGDYTGGRETGVRAGLIHPGEIFSATEEQAEYLEARGLAYRYIQPRTPTGIETFIPQPYDTKIMAPAAEPTRRRAK